MNKIISISPGRCGFHLNYENGYAISIQFRSGTYSGNYWKSVGKEEDTKTVEMAILDPNGELIDLSELPNSPISEYTQREVAAYVPIGKALEFAQEYTFRKVLYELEEA